jgi:hypothetical protein
MIQRHSINQDLSIFFLFLQNELQSEGFHLEQPKRVFEVYERISANLSSHASLYILNKTRWAQGQLLILLSFWAPDPKVFLDRHSAQVQENNSTISDKDASWPSGYFPGRSPAAERERRERNPTECGFCSPYESRSDRMR